MNIQARINQIAKRARKKLKKDEFRTVLVVHKAGDNRAYDFWDWKEKHEFNEIDKSKYEAMGGTTIFVITAFLDENGQGSGGFLPPMLKREDFG